MVTNRDTVPETIDSGPMCITDLFENIISRRTLWHFNSMFGSSHSASSAYQRLTKNDSQPPYLEF